jgi:beta-N-acetylhexosaminidase
VLVAALVLVGLRAQLASVAFMLPGGSILGWSKLPPARCTFCTVQIPAATDGSSRPRALTPSEYAALLTQRLSLDDELGQMMMVQISGQDVTPDAVQMLSSQGAGGILFFAGNIQSATQIRSLTAQVSRLAPIPLLLAVDQEGGVVNRFVNIVGPLPSAAALASPADARRRGQQDAALLHTYGFNLNLAPVVDVGDSNPQLWSRTFGTSPSRVAAMAGAYLEGLQQSGQITGTLKHFPGLGATNTDPHLGMPVLDRSRADWQATDLAPYRTLVASEDVRAILVTHEMIPAVDPNLPTSLSPAVIDDTLRRQMGFDGVVITDSLYMAALNQRWSVSQAAVLAVAAGADLIIGPYTPQMVSDAKDAFRAAIAAGTLTRSRIDTSVRRLLTLKLRMGLIPMPSPQTRRSATWTQPLAVPLAAALRRWPNAAA